jgi:predicted DNA-binding transcriptional regulator AlpA
MPLSLLLVEDIPLSSSAIYKKLEEGAFPEPYSVAGRNCWLQEDVDAWLKPEATARLILEHRDELPGGFTEYELRCRGWDGLRSRPYNLQALKLLVESGALVRKKIKTSGRPRVEYRWRA